MRIHSDLADTIGNTPLLRLRRASEMTGCNILGKCEFLNPGQSVKDRAALFMIRDAVAKGMKLEEAMDKWQTMDQLPTEYRS